MSKKGSYSSFNISKKGCELEVRLGEDYIKDFSKDGVSNGVVSFEAFSVCLGIATKNFMDTIFKTLEMPDTIKAVEDARQMFSGGFSEIVREGVNKACDKRLKKKVN